MVQQTAGVVISHPVGFFEKAGGLCRALQSILESSQAALLERGLADIMTGDKENSPQILTLSFPEFSAGFLLSPRELSLGHLPFLWELWNFKNISL